MGEDPSRAMLSFSYRDPLLINTIGHAVGTLLFGVLVGLLIQDWRHHGIRQTRLSLTAAVLALLWNLGSLLVLASSGHESPALEAVVTFSFSILSLLPAVLFHSVRRHRHRILVGCGYALSVLAVLLHFWEWILAPYRLHQVALLVIAVGFGVLVGADLFLGFRAKGPAFVRNPALLSLACLLLFSASFVHFGYGHAASAWTAEIAWHHASIPLALFVLLQDYRFLLLDVFFRFLLNFGLAAVYVLSLFAVYHHLSFGTVLAPNRFWLGLGLVGVCLLLISFAFLRARLQQWLTARLFRRQSRAECVHRLTTASAQAESEEQLLQEYASAFARYLAAQRFTVRAGTTASLDGPTVTSSLGKGRIFDEMHWVEAAVPLRFARGDACQILLGAREGGRRYLSEDLEALRALASIATEQVERFRSEALHRLVSQAELRALQSQINPHFLFNALNTLYGTIDRQSQPARRLVLNLADIFRYFLQTDRTFIRLEEELKIIRAYLEIEKLRLGDRLETCLSVPEETYGVLIPVLSIQPLVENAVKHGVAAQQGKGIVRLIVEPAEAGTWIKVQDSGPGFPQRQSEKASGSGVGLDNVRQRLHLCYGEAAPLKIATQAAGTSVSFLVPVPAGSEKQGPFRRPTSTLVSS
jgi:two-component system, LytTR family, sensor kinase